MCHGFGYLVRWQRLMVQVHDTADRSNICSHIHQQVRIMMRNLSSTYSANQESSHITDHNRSHATNAHHIHITSRTTNDIQAIPTHNDHPTTSEDRHIPASIKQGVARHKADLKMRPARFTSSILCHSVFRSFCVRQMASLCFFDDLHRHKQGISIISRPHRWDSAPNASSYHAHNEQHVEHVVVQRNNASHNNKEHARGRYQCT